MVSTLTLTVPNLPRLLPGPALEASTAPFLQGQEACASEGFHRYGDRF